MTKQLDDHSVCEGTVIDFKAGKYIIHYKNNSIVTLTKTALVKVLSPVVVEVTAATAAETAEAKAAADKKAAAKTAADMKAAAKAPADKEAAALAPAMPVAAEGSQNTVKRGEPDGVLKLMPSAKRSVSAAHGLQCCSDITVAATDTNNEHT